MKPIIRLVLCLVCLLWGSGRLWGQINYLQLSQVGVSFNLQSQRGAPISTNVNASIGSDGQMPAQNSSLGFATSYPPTTNQFASLLSFGAVNSASLATTRNLTNNPYLLGNSPFSLAVATSMNCPLAVFTNNGITNLVVRRAQVGIPYFSQTISYNFGSVIPVPASDYTGTNAEPANYWQPVPWNNSANSYTPYYFSTNANLVFATQPGAVLITWATSATYPPTSLPAYINPGAPTGSGIPNYVTNPVTGLISLLYTSRYLVSPAPVKTPQNLYWTEGSFAQLGYVVDVPAGNITALVVITNTWLTAYPNFSTNAAPATQPLWYEPGVSGVSGGTIHSYNATGLVFVELDGAPNGNGGSQYLGFELVNVAQSPTPNAVTAYLGDVLTPYADGTEGQTLASSAVNNDLGVAFYYQSGSTLYADKLTTAPSQLQVYWLDSGVAGLQWPKVFDQYNLVWPGDPSAYSYYLRPAAATQAQAMLSGIQLDVAEAPSLDYEDPLDAEDVYGGQLNQSTGFFFSWLDAQYPAQRALLRFSAGANVRFERVFSILAQGLQSPDNFAGSVITNLTAWNPTNNTFTNFAAGFNPPYVTAATVAVGQRIMAPAGELATNWISGGDYWAGYINTNANQAFAGPSSNLGNSYDPYAYVDPLLHGFAAANQGAIIPVNAVPGRNVLEVWWFRPNNANSSLGFQTVYWPAVIGDYTIAWPAGGANPIVLASQQGSGPLPAPQSAGAIYYQNDPTLPGYNPNEEHAVMLGGRAYALRDDLNLTNASAADLILGTNYSSEPFVLVSFTDLDGRPNMLSWPVLRENPAAGQYFDYITTAGSLLQAPMPLPLLPPPVAANTNYPGGFTNYDTEPSLGVNGDLPNGWTAGDSSTPYALYSAFTFQDRKNEFWVYRGLNDGLPPLAAGQFDPADNLIDLPLPSATAVAGANFISYIHLSRLLDSLTYAYTSPSGLDGLTLLETNNALAVAGIPTNTGSFSATITITDTGNNTTVTLPFSLWVTNSGVPAGLGPLVISSDNQYSGQVDTFTNRPPTLAASANSSNSFTMRFYYKTLAGFAWPGSSNPPPVGSIVPYLRPLTNGVFAGNPMSSNTPSLDIVYRPVWPEIQNGNPLPRMAVGQTLTTAVNGLPAVRGQDSVQILYQQSIATNVLFPLIASNFMGEAAADTVVLFDPTVEKKALLTNGVPTSIVTDAYNGLNFFPNLPPNLISRFWYDPNQQKLVFTGQFINDPVNGAYVMLNVLSKDDLAALSGLCSPADTVDYPIWTNAVAQLSVNEYTYGDDVYGNYVINANATATRTAMQLVTITNSDTAVDSYALSAAGPGQGYVSFVVANGLNPSYAGDPVSIYIVRVAQPLFTGALVLANGANASPFSQLTTFEHTADLAGRTGNYLYDWRIAPPVNGQPPPLGTEASWPQLFQANPGPVYTLGANGIQGLCDNYVSLRYGQVLTNKSQVTTNWSDWVNPLLAEGWISRVTQALDPIAGQTQNLYDNPATTTASIIQLAGARWNGDVPLNAASLTNNGLIQLYETVLDVGKNLSINSGINYGPANQALLTAAGYLNDLYMTLGNEAWANSLNPTISFGSDSTPYGSVATASFCFEGEEPTLLEQNLALLRGRDDSLSPGVDLPPVYNRLYWNFTYGLAAGQVIYTLNYDITDQNGDGVVNAADAAIMYPQGHGDAYGHYLTALMNYYELLLNPNFDWVPQAQTVNVLGAAVTVNYQNETKFAASAAALARAGRQIFDLTWREDYQPGTAGGWAYFASNYVGQYTYVDNSGAVKPITRYWGMDHWASRAGQGTYINWVVGNALLPYADNNPQDQGVQIVDRQTVAELQELPQSAAELQADMDNAEAGFTPLSLPQNAIPFDINPQQVTGSNPQTHFQQVYTRAVQALNNAATAFNAAQNVTQELRQEQNSLADLQASVEAQEDAYNDQLIELYGTPYPDDIGPGGTYPQGYAGPDLVHYLYVDNVDTNTYGGVLPDPTTAQQFVVPVLQLPNLPTNWYDTVISSAFPQLGFLNALETNSYQSFTFNVTANGFLQKPATWTDERGSVGSIQNAIAAVDLAQDQYRQACYNAQSDAQAFNQAVALFDAQTNLSYQNLALQQTITDDQVEIDNTQTGFGIANSVLNALSAVGNDGLSFLQANQTDEYFEPAGYLAAANAYVFGAQSILQIAETADLNNYQTTITTLSQEIATNQTTLSLQSSLQSLQQLQNQVQNDLGNINQDLMALNGAQGNYQSLLAQGNRIQAERETFREHTAAQVQGDTVADSAFLVFQNEDLERYTSLFNLAAEYTYMAANAYDYETGLLGTPAGQSLLNQIVSSSALGVIQNGEPQLSGTDTGDPGLANALAEMNTDWSVLQGRLGFNNPDGYGTTVSLRSENYRILPGPAGDAQWRELLQNNLVPDLLADTDVKNNCLQVDDGSGTSQPGIILQFGTTITDGENLFGQPLAPGDHAYSTSSFATKIFSVGVCFDGYEGMDNPVSNSGAGGTSPSDPTLDANALAATPYIYLIPCGADSMRSPPLGDTSTIRTWNVDDVAIPLPLNVGDSDFSTTPFYTSSDSLSEPLFTVRKQQAFRPVSTTAAFNTSIYGADGALEPSQYTNQRLIGRSIWNSKWKLVIPGKTLLADPNQGLARFINEVTDVHLYFITYSYSGN